MVGWWVGAVLGFLVLAPLLLVLGARVVRQAWEASRYGDDILVHGVELAGTLDAVPGLAAARDLVADARAAAVDYVSALRRLRRR